MKDNYLLIWTKMVGAWPEFTGCIINKDYKLLHRIDLLFEKGSGAHPLKVKEILKQLGINYNLMGAEKDSFFVGKRNGRGVPLEEMNIEKAIAQFKADRVKEERITGFLTPEAKEQILNNIKNSIVK